MQVSTNSLHHLNILSPIYDIYSYVPLFISSFQRYTKERSYFSLGWLCILFLFLFSLFGNTEYIIGKALGSGITATMIHSEPWVGGLFIDLLFIIFLLIVRSRWSVSVLSGFHSSCTGFGITTLFWEPRSYFSLVRDGLQWFYFLCISVLVLRQLFLFVRLKKHGLKLGLPICKQLCTSNLVNSGHHPH